LTGLIKKFSISRYKVKAFPYSIPSVGPGAHPGVQAVSMQVTVSHPPGGRLSLLSDRPAVTSPAAEHHRPLAGTKLYCLVTEAHRWATRWEFESGSRYYFYESLLAHHC